MHETGLLVSVRDAEEAEAALQGGAALIDIKEPARGPLGRADDGVMRAIVAVVAGRRPVSAALGEWEDKGRLPDADLTYVKWGLAGCQRRADWQPALRDLLAQRSPQIVLAAYADWQCAQAPCVDDVFALAAERPGGVLLVDTCCKNAPTPHGKPPTLLDWLPAAHVEELCARCRAAGVRIALAGSLGVTEIAALRNARPDWFAVRGAVCPGRDRRATVEADRVRELVQVITKTRAG